MCSEKSLTAAVKERARALGADLVGVAPISRFENAPLRMSPQGLFPEAKSVIVVGIHHPDATIELNGDPTAHNIGSYLLQVPGMNWRLDDISFMVSRFLETRGYRTLPISASNIWRYHGYKDLKVDFAPDMAHRYAAVAAGLGEIGWNGLCLTPEFGPRNRFVSIVTEAELEPTPMYSGESLCDKCMECVRNCPTDAFRKEVRGMAEVDIDSRSFSFPLTNKWRCAWAENFTLDLDHQIPDEVNEEVILSYMEKYGTRGGEMGACLRFCMTPQKRYYDHDYSRAPRRKKPAPSAEPAEIAKHLEAICEEIGIDVMTVADSSIFDDDKFVNPELHLPDVSSVICLGLREPKGSEGSESMERSLPRRLTYAGFRIAHDLDIEGYSANTRTRISDVIVAERLGIRESGLSYLTVLTSADLPAKTLWRSRSRHAIDAETLRSLCREKGADLVGFFNESRYQTFMDAIQAAGYLPETRTVIRDTANRYQPFVPEVHEEDLVPHSLKDWLPDGCSVIVLGLHFPDAALDLAKVTPAESIGPYGFVAYESLRLLEDIAFDVMQELSDKGHSSVATWDLAGLASTVMNCRGTLPDMRANEFASILSGLAYQGVHGYPITPEYGVRQRWIAIVTDMDLPNDPLFTGTRECDTCERPCVSGCLTKALNGQNLDVAVDGTEVRLYQVNNYRCDWAKAYSLSGEAGSSYYGVDVNFDVPEEGTDEDVVHALTRAAWGVQKRLLNICEECLRVCPAGGNDA
ncbi:MAG: hypothetical protein ACP5HS_13395 [Anaerolineae bacterium]